MYTDNITQKVAEAAQKIIDAENASVKKEEIKKEDTLISESAEQVDEVSKDFLTRGAFSTQDRGDGYISKAVMAHLIAKSKGDHEKAAKRAKGINLARAKVFPKQYANSLDKAKVPATNEEVEQIDEISKHTLGSYIKKASHKAAHLASASRKFAMDSEAQRKDHNWVGSNKSMERSDKAFNKSWKTRQGIAKATDRLTKENIEQIDEMSPGSQGIAAAGGGTPASQGIAAAKKDFAKKPEPKKVKEEIESVEEAMVKPKNAAELRKINSQRQNAFYKPAGSETVKTSKVSKASAEDLHKQRELRSFGANKGHYGGHGSPVAVVRGGGYLKAGRLGEENTEEETMSKPSFTEMLESYKEGGIKKFFENFEAVESVVEEVEQVDEESTSAEFAAELEKAKRKAAGTEKADVAKAASQSVVVQKEEVER